MSDRQKEMMMKKAPGKGGVTQIPPGTIKRLLQYLGSYRVHLVIVVICILVSAGASVAASLFIQVLIDDFITPLLLESNPVFTGLLQAVGVMACIYVAGILGTLIYNRMMAVIAQGTLRNIRDAMFEKMQRLPIRYFDTHTHGDVMSHYTNDTDTLRQMISQSLPQAFSSCVTILAVFCSMLYLSIWLTLFVLAAIVIILWIIRKIAGKSSTYFIKQQEALGTVNGFIEEMINGQKVVKVFCHEEKAKEDFDKVNDEEH